MNGCPYYRCRFPACPSAHDPARNRHRCGLAWNKFAVRAILVDPRYTGYQVWSKQRKDEVLIDVGDVALGHTTKLRWNDSAVWIWSEKIVHPPVIGRETFDQVQVMISGRATSPAGHKPHRRQHPYALRGCLCAASAAGGGKATWVNSAPYYRCRFPAEYALANQVEHPLNVNLREDAIIGHVDQGLAIEFAPHRLTQTIRDLAAAQHASTIRDASDHEDTARKIAECVAKTPTPTTKRRSSGSWASS